MKKGTGKLFTKNYILLMLSGLAISFGYSMIAPLITPYGVFLGAGLAAAGALTGVFSIAALVIRPFGGYASDVFKKRNLCIFSTLLIAIAMLGYSIAPGMKTMFAVRILHGIAFGIQGTVNAAILYEFLPKERLAEGIGYYSLGQVISQVFGPGLGIEIRDQYGYKQLFWIIALITFVAIIFVLFTDKEATNETIVTEPKKEKFRFSIGSMIALPCIVYALIGGLFSLENGIVNSFLVLAAEERKIAGISMFFTINAAVLFVIRMAVGKIVDKRRSITLIVNISLITSVIAMLILGGGKNLWILLVAAAFKAIGQGTGQITLQTASMKKVDATKVGIATSTFYIGADLGQGFGPIICGELTERLGYTAMFYSIAILIALSLIGFNLYQRKESLQLKGGLVR